MDRKLSWALGAAAVVVLASVFLLGRSSPESAVIETIDAQVAMINARDVDGLWAQMTPRARSACSRDAAAAASATFPEGATGTAALENAAVVIEGDRATVTGALTVDGTLAWMVMPDQPLTLVRSGDRWLLDDGPLLRMACAKLAGVVPSSG